MMTHSPNPRFVSMCEVVERSSSVTIQSTTKYDNYWFLHCSYGYSKM
jgi:hypothetical protein